MNLLKKIIPLILLTLALTSCKNETKAEVKTVSFETKAKQELDPKAIYAKAEFTIDGMTCEMGCARTIEKKITNMIGVKSATVDFDKKKATVEYNTAKVNPTALTKTVTGISKTYKVSHMETLTTSPQK